MSLYLRSLPPTCHSLATHLSTSSQIDIQTHHATIIVLYATTQQDDLTPTLTLDTINISIYMDFLHVHTVALGFVS
jgi:hypothetical protein